LGWLAFGGNLVKKGDLIETSITTAAKNKVYIAPIQLWCTLDAGSFEKVRYNSKTKSTELILGAKSSTAPFAYLRVPENIELPYPKVRGAYKIPLETRSISIKF